MVELDHAILPQGRVPALLVNLLFRHFFGLVGNETHTLWTGKDIDRICEMGMFREPFAKAQVAYLERLCRKIKTRWNGHDSGSFKKINE